MKVKIVSQIAQIKPSAALAFNEKVQTLVFSGKKIYHFGFGESRFPVQKDIKKAFIKAADKISYEPVGGIPVLREQIALYWNKKFGTKFTAENVLIGAGSKILLHDCLRVIEGDLILPVPTWVAYAPQAKMLGKKVIYVNSDASNLEQKVKEARKNGLKPKILLLTSPGNPTGVELSNSQIIQITKICRKLNLIVISDEIYAQINHGIISHTCFAKYYSEGTIVTSGLSKAFSLGGWRLGFALLPNNELGKTIGKYLKIVAGNSWSMASAPVQYAAVEAFSLKKDVEKYVANCAKKHALRTQKVYQELKKIGLEAPQPHGGFYVYISFDKFAKKLLKLRIRNSVDLSNYLLEKYQIAALPGVEFCEPPQRLTLRLSTSYLSDLDLSKSLSYFRDFLEVLRK